MTPRQAEVLAYIGRYLATEGMAPSVREIATFLKVRPNAAQCHLNALEAAGAIRRSPGIPRSIRILETEHSPKEPTTCPTELT
jgi:repressor LexA